MRLKTVACLMLWVGISGCIAGRGVHADAIKIPHTRPDSDFIVGPVDLVQQGIIISVPLGWTGENSQSGELRLKHSRTGVGADIFWQKTASEVLTVNFGPNCDKVFNDDVGTYRASGDDDFTSAQTCLSDDPYGPTIQAWFGRFASTTVLVKSTYPLGTAVEGSDLLVDLLLGISPSQQTK